MSHHSNCVGPFQSAASHIFVKHRRMQCQKAANLGSQCTGEQPSSSTYQEVGQS